MRDLPPPIAIPPGVYTGQFTTEGFNPGSTCGSGTMTVEIDGSGLLSRLSFPTVQGVDSRGNPGCSTQGRIYTRHSLTSYTIELLPTPAGNGASTTLFDNSRTPFECDRFEVFPGNDSQPPSVREVFINLKSTDPPTLDASAFFNLVKATVAQ